MAFRLKIITRNARALQRLDPRFPFGCRADDLAKSRPIREWLYSPFRPLLKNEWVEMGEPAPPCRRTHGGTGVRALVLVKPLPPQAVAAGIEVPFYGSMIPTILQNVDPRLMHWIFSWIGRGNPGLNAMQGRKLEAMLPNVLPDSSTKS
jgi:hypothetical protein